MIKEAIIKIVNKGDLTFDEAQTVNDQRSHYQDREQG